MQSSNSSDQYIPLATIGNLRDLGGLRLAEGSIQAEKLFRSANPGFASASDRAQLQQRGIHIVVDFRDLTEKSVQEADFSANFNWIAQPIRVGNLSSSDLLPALPQMTTQETTQLMQNLYREFPIRFQAEFKALLQLAEQGETLLYHCTAGKDRTGFATFLLLSALGADSDTIYENYLISNQYNQKMHADLRAMLNQLGLTVNEELLSPLVSVHASYLRAAEEVIQQEFGDVYRFLRDVLQVDSEKIKQHYLV